MDLVSQSVLPNIRTYEYIQGWLEDFSFIWRQSFQEVLGTKCATDIGSLRLTDQPRHSTSELLCGGSNRGQAIRGLM